MKYTIIVAEDEPITRMDICEMLTEAGYAIVGQAADGFQAVELCRVNRPNLLLADIKMPQLDGLKAAKIVSDEDLVDSVILLTAYSGSEFIAQAKEAGVTGYIVKPIVENTLIAEIEIAVSKGQEMRKLKAEVEKSRVEIEKRKVIDHAKKILIKKYDISENEAYRRIRSDGMNSRVSVYDVARSIIDQAEK